jgi:Tfp pilus assembly PilM family ATPase
MVAAPRKAKDELLDILRAAGLEPDVIDIAPLPALNALLRSRGTAAGGEEPVALMDLGGLSRVLAVALPGGEVYTRNLKRSGDGSAEGTDEDVTHLIQEAADTLRFLNVRRRGDPIREIHLCGGASLSDVLRERISGSLGVDVRIPDPFAGLEMTAASTPAPAERACMVSAVGLALWWQE